MIELAKGIGSHSTQRGKKTENQFQCSVSLIVNQNKGSELWFEMSQHGLAPSFLISRKIDNGTCVSWLEAEDVCVGFSTVPAALQVPHKYQTLASRGGVKTKGVWAIVILGMLV